LIGYAFLVCKEIVIADFINRQRESIKFTAGIAFLTRLNMIMIIINLFKVAI